MSFASFFLVFSAWAFAAPYGGPPDETQHAIRAVGVVSGQIAPKPVVIPNWNGRGDAGMGAYQRVPEGIANHSACWGFNPEQSAACAPGISGGRLVELPSSAGRYGPVYYLMVGLPLRLWPGWGGLVLARLCSAALSAALLACAFVTLARRSRYGLMLAGLLACTTPMLAHLAGALNPNGLEIAAGMAFFSAAIPLLLDRSRPRAPLIALAGVSGVLLASVRSLGPLWLGVGIVALLVPLTRGRLGRLAWLWRARLSRRWIVAVGAALSFSLGWTTIMKTGQVVPTGKGEFDYGLSQAALMYLSRWDVFLEGMIGVAGWFDIFMPAPLYWIWAMAVGSLVLFAIAFGSVTERVRFAIVLVGVVVVPGLLQISQARVIGFIIGGRYMMPLMVAMPLLAAFILERRLLQRHHCRTITRFFCLLLIPMHLVLLDYAMVRWQRGIHPDPRPTYLNPFVGTWHPPTGSVVAVVIMIVGMALMAWVFWNVPRFAPATGVRVPHAGQPATSVSVAPSATTTLTR